MAFMGAIFPVVLWGIFILQVILGNENPSTSTVPLIFGVITLLAVLILAWRLILINTVFSDGIETNATINKAFFFRDKGTITFVYTYMGEKYSSSNVVMKWKRTKGYKSGMDVEVMIDRNRPKRAFIRDLYS